MVEGEFNMNVNANHNINPQALKGRNQKRWATPCDNAG